MTSESTWQERLQIEHDELVERLAKLSAFVDTSEFDALTGAEKYLLHNQRSTMKNYRMILEARLERANES